MDYDGETSYDVEYEKENDNDDGEKMTTEITNTTIRMRTS